MGANGSLKEEMGEKQREAELRYYLLRLFRCTGFADSIYSVDDLRLNIEY